MTLPFIVLLLILIGGLFISVLLDYLNLKNIKYEIPEEFKDFYSEKKYSQSQKYLYENTRLSIFEDIFSTILIITFIVLGGFNFIDIFVRSLIENTIIQGLLFFGNLLFLASIISLPFQIYHTFVIEEKFGFNKTNLKTFVLDRIKGIILGITIGAPALALILWFFESTQYAWVYSWLFLVFFQLFLLFLAPITIMPLFNKYSPLKEGELKTEIENFARKENFLLAGLFTMDGSKRSSKANAFFTGFGKFRRIVLFDTLIEKHTTKELVAILAHEIGHYKLKHIYKQMLVGFVSSFVTFYVLSFFINNQFIFEAFKMENISVYASLLFFGFFYSPISSLISFFSLYLSRKYEFEADKYALDTYGSPNELIAALKKLSVDNLSNLYPHPLKVFFEYTHPPVLKRIEALRKNHI